MRSVFGCFVLAILATGALQTDAFAANPLFDRWYADPQIRRFGDRYWIYLTYSQDFKEQTFMDVFSSKDLRTWTKHPQVLTTNEVKWARGAMWAPDAQEKDGKYYLFFAANDAYPVGGKRQDGEPQKDPGIGKYGGIGVAVADRPEGPYRDLIGKPLIDRFWNAAQPIDQYVFKYGNEWYMLYGGWGRCNLVRLADDFKSLKLFEDGRMWKDMTPKDYVEGSVMFERQGKWYFMYSCGSWTADSYRVNYGMSDTPFGPFEFKGCVLSSQRPIATGAGHHSVVCMPRTDEWYICYHRRPVPNESPHHRVVCLDRMYFNADGSIKPVVMTGEVPNKRTHATVRPCAMRTLPPGSIRPEGHLRERLERQAKGLTGHAEELYRDIGKSDWLTNAGVGGEYSWERGPYYARGLVALAFTLGDENLKACARKWVDAVIASQRENGDFGPRKNNWWANMLPQGYLRDWADATGDKRVVPFLEKYYRYQREEFKNHTFENESCWACARTGDELEAVYWLYERTGNPEWLDFAKLLCGMAADWTTYYHIGGDPGRNAKSSGGYRCHIVNFMQGLKYPALKWRMSGDEHDRTAYAAAFDPDGWTMRKCGRPDRMVNGSEPLADRSASGGTELCAIAERIISCGTALSVLGDPVVADDLEDVAYNSLAATATDDMKGIRYYLLLNQPICTDKGLMFANQGFGSEITGANCPGPHSGFGCCRSNWHVAWPKFVQTMWMLKEDGIAAVAHGPSSVTAKLPCGEVMLREETDYPRSGKVTVRVVDGGGKFPLFVRIPHWAKTADAGTFRKYERDWKSGDAVELDFPMDISLSYWANGAVAVRRGPFLYSLKIDEEWKKVERYKVPYENVWVENGGGEFPRWEIRPKSPWNYALVLKDGALEGAEVLADGAEIRVKAVRTEAAGWGYMRADAPGRAVDPPQSPVDRHICSSEEMVTLVPLGMTQLRITLFPWVKR